MKPSPALFLCLLLALLAPLCALHANDAPIPLSPNDGAVVHAPHPHFRWEREADIKIEETHRIQIAKDEAFGELACEDQLGVVSRFVPVHALTPGKYWWRVCRGKGPWSRATAFEVRVPEKRFVVPTGSDAAAVKRALEQAATQGPARVEFEPGVYTLVPGAGETLVTLSKARDLVVDGHGAHLVLGGTLLSLIDCERVTIRRFTITPERPGHTLVRVVHKDPQALSLTVKPEPGYPTDVSHYFEFAGTGGSFLGCMDPVNHGKYIAGAGVSARNAKIAASSDGDGSFVISPVRPETLALIPDGALAVVTAYHWQWVKTTRTTECTFSELTLSNLPGAFCGGGGNDTAKSFLQCTVKPSTARDYFGGHSHTGSGRIGEWIEGCNFECLADDGPAQQSFRLPIKGVEGTDTVLVGGSSIRAGDKVSLVHTRGGRGASALVKEAQGPRVQLDRTVSDLAGAIGQDPLGDWKNVFIYRDAPSNEDFVYRHNSHIGGRAHGVKFNGTRAWIADNHFENINGNAVLAGYVSEVSGHGARDVVVSGNTILRCGWTPIEACATSGLGGNILIRGNRIVETREAAVAIKGCTPVTIADNVFTSSTQPKKGAWITTSASGQPFTSGNNHTGEVPLLGPVNPGKEPPKAPLGTASPPP
jgi:hypothetical protein